MRRSVLIARSTPSPRSLRRLARPKAVPRTFKSCDIVIPTGRRAIEREFAPPLLGYQIDPYFDYGRYLTAEGGILFIFKDLDVRLRHTIWRLFAWTLFTGIAAFYLTPYTPVQTHWTKIVGLLAVVVINFLVVRKPVELYRRIEVRPDCLIVEESDVFWSRQMECGLPTFRPDEGGNHILCGIYGTRFVEFLTVRRFDDYDRMFEVFSAHLQDAMQQQWSRPY